MQTLTDGGVGVSHPQPKILLANQPNFQFLSANLQHCVFDEVTITIVMLRSALAAFIAKAKGVI